jgi:hypothetical protein
LLALRRYREAGQAARTWLKVLPARDAWQPVAERRLRQAELGKRLPALLKGDEQPADATQRLDLADLCQLKRHYATAARLCAEAFAEQPKLADDLKAWYRYSAACCAALAGCGKGEDAGKLDDQERTELRKQALLWLRAALDLWAKRLNGGKPRDRQEVAAKMLHWQKDSDLAGLRDPAALAKLPAGERQGCEKLWADVAALLREAQTASPRSLRQGR